MNDFSRKTAERVGYQRRSVPWALRDEYQKKKRGKAAAEGEGMATRIYEGEIARQEGVGGTSLTGDFRKLDLRPRQ